MKRKKIIGSSTSYPGLTAFRNYIEGTGTLEDFRKAGPPVVKILYSEVADEPLDDNEGSRVAYYAFSIIAAFVGGLAIGAIISWLSNS